MLVHGLAMRSVEDEGLVRGEEFKAKDWCSVRGFRWKRIGIDWTSNWDVRRARNVLFGSIYVLTTTIELIDDITRVERSF